tara:strand:+ start:485 stop:670 length:186 start_codon:yes stop_codon:yes gene_type:complete
MATLSKEWIKDRKAFLSEEWIKASDDVSELRDKLIDAEDNLNDIAAELDQLKSMNYTTINI